MLKDFMGMSLTEFLPDLTTIKRMQDMLLFFLISITVSLSTGYAENIPLNNSPLDQTELIGDFAENSIIPFNAFQAKTDATYTIANSFESFLCSNWIVFELSHVLLQERSSIRQIQNLFVQTSNQQFLIKHIFLSSTIESLSLIRVA